VRWPSSHVTLNEDVSIFVVILDIPRLKVSGLLQHSVLYREGREQCNTPFTGSIRA